MKGENNDAPNILAIRSSQTLLNPPTALDLKEEDLDFKMSNEKVESQGDEGGGGGDSGKDNDDIKLHAPHAPQPTHG